MLMLWHILVNCKKFALTCSFTSKQLSMQPESYVAKEEKLCKIAATIAIYCFGHDCCKIRVTLFSTAAKWYDV